MDKNSISRLDDDAVTIDVEGITLEGKTQDDALNDWLTEMGSLDNSVRMGVYRDATEHRGKQPYLFDFDPSDYNSFSLANRLRDDYKGGDFRLKVYNEKSRLLMNKPFSVEPINEEVTQSQTIETERLRVEKEQTTISEVMDRMIGMQEKNQSNLLNVVAAIAPLLIPLFTNRTPVTPPMGPTEMIALMGAIKGLSGGDEGPRSVDTLLKGIKLAKDLGGGGDTNEFDTMGKLMEMGAPAIVALANNAAKVAPVATPLAAPAQPVTRQPMITPAVATSDAVKPVVVDQPSEEVADQSTDQPTTISPALSTGSEMMDVLQQQMGMLLSRAENNSDPSLYVELMLDLFELDRLRTIFDHNTYNILASLNADIAKYEPWFKEFAEAMEMALYEESEENGQDNLGDGLTGSEPMPDNDESEPKTGELIPGANEKSEPSDQASTAAPSGDQSASTADE